MKVKLKYFTQCEEFRATAIKISDIKNYLDFKCATFWRALFERI